MNIDAIMGTEHNAVEEQGRIIHLLTFPELRVLRQIDKCPGVRGLC